MLSIFMTIQVGLTAKWSWKSGNKWTSVQVWTWPNKLLFKAKVGLSLFSSVCGNSPHCSSFGGSYPPLSTALFKVWSLDHRYQNHLRCLFKMHIPRPYPNPNGKVVQAPQKALIVACFSGGSMHASMHLLLCLFHFRNWSILWSTNTIINQTFPIA